MTCIVRNWKDLIQNMTEQQVLISVERRFVIKLLINKGVNPTEILLRLQTYVNIGKIPFPRPECLNRAGNFLGS